MAFTPEQLAKIAQKEASLPDALKRNTMTNYREGYFFITLNTRNYAPILSTIAGLPDANDGEPNAPRCIYTKLGRKVMEVWQTIPQYHPYTEIIAAEAMPDHFHGLLRLKAGNRKHLGHILGGFMGGCTHEYWDMLGIDWRKDREVRLTKGAAALPPDRDADHTRSLRGPSLFVRGYNDMEAITPEQLRTKLQYIHEQARRALIKGAFRDRFCIQRSRTSHGWTLEALRQAFIADRYLAHDPQRLEAALRSLLPRIPMQPMPTATTQQQPHPTPTQQPATQQQPPPMSPKPLLSYIGSYALLAAERKLPLICHRSDAPFFDRQRDAVLSAARSGAVIVSAFISPREREIMKLLLMEQLPVIEVVDNGFADRYKPTGKRFYACAENRLVQISPWTYEYQRDNMVTREMCLVMNQLVRVIAGRGEEWWKREK